MQGAKTSYYRIDFEYRYISVAEPTGFTLSFLCNLFIFRHRDFYNIVLYQTRYVESVYYTTSWRVKVQLSSQLCRKYALIPAPWTIFI